jgi:hypothetical protein
MIDLLLPIVTHPPENGAFKPPIRSRADQDDTDLHVPVATLVHLYYDFPCIEMAPSSYKHPNEYNFCTGISRDPLYLLFFN